MATTLKNLRALRTTMTPIARRNNSTFKDPWQYPASARESWQSFREAKVEFNHPEPQKVITVTAVSQAMIAPPPTKKDVSKQATLETVIPNPATDARLSPPVDHGGWGTESRCPFQFMPYLDEQRVTEVLSGPGITQSAAKAEEEEKEEAKEEEEAKEKPLGGWSLIWG